MGALPAARGIRLVEYPVWMWHWATPADPRVPWAAMRALPLDGPAREAKRAAIRAHASQVDPLSDAPEDAAVLRPDVASVEIRAADGHDIAVASVPPVAS